LLFRKYTRTRGYLSQGGMAEPRLENYPMQQGTEIQHSEIRKIWGGDMKAEKQVESYVRNQELITMRRQQIIDGAIKVFTSKGFHKSTVKEIAEASKLTMGTMYNYVRSKEDILYIVYDHMNSILMGGLKKAIDNVTDPKDELRAALKQNMDTIEKYQDIILFLYNESSAYDRKSLHTVLAQESQYVELFEEFLRKSFEGEKINESRLMIAADILAYVPVILALRRWSLKRRCDDMEIVKESILDLMEHAIQAIREE
jgi:AcrR family transcriptional regulator